MRLGRVVFLGTGEFGVPLLGRLAALTDDLLVITQPDRPAGRGYRVRASPVGAFARDAGLRVETPHRLRSSEGRRCVSDFRPDGLLLAAYGQLVPDDLLAVGDRAPLNVHPSLLPRHRGAAPVAATLLAGDSLAGLTLMVMTAQLDAGPIVEQWQVPLDGRETTPQLEGRLAELAADVLPPVLARWSTGEPLPAEPQDERQASLVRPFHRDDGWIEWGRSAVEIDRQVRAMQPWPGAWTTLDGLRLHVRAATPRPGIDGLPIGALVPGPIPSVACGSGALVLDIVQPEGKSPMPGSDWRRGLAREHLLLGTSRPGATS